MVDFSKLRHRIEIQSPNVETENSMGEKIVGWGVWANLFAFVEPLRGREYAESQKLRAETTYRVTIRYIDGLIPAMRILYNGKTLEIMSILDIDERHEQMQIIAFERSEVGEHG